MNRLLLTAAAALAMGVSGHAMAASYTLDDFSGANAVGNDFVTLAGSGTSYSTGPLNYTSIDGFAFTRNVDFTQTTGVDAASLLMTDNYLGETLPADQLGAYVMNPGGTASALALTYNIGSLASTVGSGSVKFDVTILNSDAGSDHQSYVTAYLNGSATPFDTWTLAAPVEMGAVPPVSRSFTVAGADVTANSQISFVLTGANGYNTTLAPLMFDVLPVPELGLLPMFGSGLLVVGFAVRRKSRANAL